MFITNRSTTNTRNKFLGLLALVCLGVASTGLSGCAGLVSGASSNTSNTGGGTSTPLAITNATAASVTMTGVQVDWTTSAPATSQVNYGKTSAYGSTTGVNSTMVSTHQTGIATLAAGTTYHFQVSSTDANGNSATSSDMTFTTLSDTTPPTVSIATPAAGATISGTAVIISATASDNVAVANVQFKVDNASTGSPVTAAPYTYSLNTTTLSNGNHTLTAVATDTAGNSATSVAVSIKVSNTTADTTPPTVSMTAPVNAATVSGTVAVAATASDNVAVASVQFQLDNANVGTAVLIAPYTFSWDTTKSTNGAHTLRAIARDTSSNSTTSSSVTVTVNNTTADTTPPTVSMTAPANGATVSNTVTVSANASDNVAVASVQFQLDNANVGTADTVTPYTFSWDTTKSTNGTHTLRAIATDTSNNSTTSASVTVTVNNATDTTPPSVPTGLSATAASSSQINLSWTASTDNVGVTGYKVFRGGAQIGTSSTNSYSDAGLTASTSYTYNVSAFDAAGNNSAQSAGASATTLASGGGGGQIPSTVGWFQIPNTALQPQCFSPSPGGTDGSCVGLVGDWSGAVADTTRNRLVLWGGGHSNYFGNELYSLNLAANPITMTRLNSPSSVGTSYSGCSDTYPDGKPAARHTYDTINYIPTNDTLFAAGSPGVSACGSVSDGIWSLNMSSLAWKRFGSGGWTVELAPWASAYDPNSGLVYFDEGQDLLTINPSTGAVTNVGGGSVRNLLAYSSLVVDPVHKYLFLMGGDNGGNTGGNLYRWDISAGHPGTSPTDLLGSATGCSQWLATTTANTGAGSGPGVQWYPVRNKIVLWNGGNSVGIYDPVANSCTTETYTGGPGAQQSTGTFGRFNYFPALGVFAVVNNATQNAYTLRLDAGTGGTAPSGPVISSVGTTSITTSAATIGWTTDVNSTSQVEYGTTTAYGTMTALNSSLVTTHSVQLTGLAINTLYHFRVHSKNSSGVESISGDFTFQTNNNSDTTAPTVSITSPANGATLSGTTTLTASASDNVGVTSVQFQLDGASIGSALTSSPYSESWNSATASNGVHVLTAQASDAAGNVATSIGVSVTVSNSATTADQNFQQRCAAPGVLNCQGFDSAALFTTSANSTTITDGFTSPANNPNNIRDTAVFVSGGASAKFHIPANAGVNCCANYWGHFGQGANNVHIGQNSDFYVQFAFRADSTWTSKGWVADSFPKLVIFHSLEGGSCANEEITTVNTHTLDTLQMYTDCGAQPLYTCSDGAIYTTGCNGLLYGEQGWLEPTPFTGYQCEYGNGAWNSPDCFNFVADQWYTLYWHVHIGTWGTSSSSVEAWIAPYGQQLRKWINVHNIPIAQDPSAPGFNVLELTQFMTAHSGSNPAANVWYDELIISTQPIPAPAGQTP